LFVSSRRDAAEEYVKSTWKADFTYFPSAENKARFGDYFSKSKWIKSSLVSRVISVRYRAGRILLCPPSHNQLVIERGFTIADEKPLAR